MARLTSAGVRSPEVGDVNARDQLLLAASELMTERGVADVSLSDIAKKSGLSSALVKYYFGSKAGLMMALLRMVLDPAMKQLDHLAHIPQPADTKLRIHISGMVNVYFQYPYVNRVMHQLLVDEPQTYGPLIAQEISKPVANAQKSILDEGYAAGIFRKVDPLLFYFEIVGACDQLFFGRYQLEHVFGLTTLDKQLKDRFVDHLCGTILDGIYLRK